MCRAFDADRRATLHGEGGWMERVVKVSTGVELCTHVEGEGVPLLLIMGIRLQLIHWPPDLCAALQARGLQVIRFDNRDAGRSTILHPLGRPSLGRLAPVPVAPPAYTLDDMAADTLGLLDALGLSRVHVFGVSMGGMIAQHMALRAPERVQSLSLLMTTPGGTWLPSLRALRGLVRPAAVDGPEAYAEAFLSVQEVLRGPGSDPFSAEEQDAMRLACHAAWERCPFPSEAAFLRQLAAVLNAPNRSRRLAGLRIPTRVIHGACDPLIPLRAGRHLARSIPGAELHVIDGMGHGLPRRHRGQVAELVASHVLRHT